jgi:hypothetical protein
MKPRHAIALALYGLGWYLMLPPMVGGHTDTSAPLNSWRMTTGSYDAPHSPSAAPISFVIGST